MDSYDWKYFGKIVASVCLSALIGFFWISNQKKSTKVISINKAHTLGQVLKHEFEDKKAIVTFWASWCKSCKEDLNSLNNLKFSHPGIFKTYKLIAINLDKKEDRESILKFWGNLNLQNLNLLFDTNNEYQTKLSIDLLPTHFVFEKDGQVVLRLEGKINWEDKKILSLL